MGYLDSLMGRKERVVFITRQHWLEMLIVGIRDGAVFLTIAVATFLLRGVVDNNIVLILLLFTVFPSVFFKLFYCELFEFCQKRHLQHPVQRQSKL